MEGKSEPKQSRFGIASVILSIVIFILANLVFLIYLRFVGDPSLQLFVNILCLITVILPVFSLLLGIVGILEKNRNKFFAYLGIGFSILFIIIEIFGYFAFKELSQITL
jgi:hypothetical protein